MERVLKDDDVSGSSFSSCQLDRETIGLAARVHHHHLVNQIFCGCAKQACGWYPIIQRRKYEMIHCTSVRDGWRSGRNLARNSDLEWYSRLVVALLFPCCRHFLTTFTLQFHLADRPHCCRPNGEDGGGNHYKPGNTGIMILWVTDSDAEKKRRTNTWRSLGCEWPTWETLAAQSRYLGRFTRKIEWICLTN